MATRTVRLEEPARRVLRRAFDKVRAQAEPVPVEVQKGTAAVERPDEVLVLVLGAGGGLVSRKAVHGRPVDMRELALNLAGAEAAVEKLALEPALTAPPLTPPEAALLGRAGLLEADGIRPGALEKSRIEYELLVRQSLPLERASKNLGVNPSRLRQRLAARTLYGIKEGRTWRIPTFQLDARRKKLVRGIDQVLPHLRPDVHPLAVATWFSTPHPDLVVGEDEVRVSPRQWLAAGSSPEVVAKLADEL